MKFRLLIVCLLIYNFFQNECFALPSNRIDRSKLQPLNYFTLKDLKFTYQPYEAEGIPCTFEFTPGMNDYKIICKENQFSVHFFVRPYNQPEQLLTEVLMLCRRITDNPKLESNTSTSFWLHSPKISKVESMLVSLGVDNDTASLDARFILEN